MSAITCFYCKSKYVYNNTKMIDMAYKGVMMKPGRSYCIAKGKAKRILNEFKPQSFCPKAQSPHCLLWLTPTASNTYECARNYKIKQIYMQTPFNAHCSIETIAEWLKENGVAVNDGDILCILGDSGYNSWKYIYNGYADLSYFAIKNVPGLPQKLLKYCKM